MSVQLILFLFFIIGCSTPIKNVSTANIPLTVKKYGFLQNSYISCTGSGKIDSKGPFSGELKFKYMSQNDSSFMQFKDFLGRKALLMWLTPDEVIAWNIIENKKYNYDQILEFFPIFTFFNSNDMTQFLWGAQPILKNFAKNNSVENNKDLSLEFKTGYIDQNPLSLISATFRDLDSNQYLKIEIEKRIHHKTVLNIGELWNLIQS